MAKQLPKRDLENVGLGVTGACVALVTLVVAALIFMVAQKGLSAFVKDGVSVVEFFTGTKWDLANTAENGLPYTGALPRLSPRLRSWCSPRSSRCPSPSAPPSLRSRSNPNLVPRSFSRLLSF
ncbi:MAG: hypothetical protein ACLU37_10940 [Collinsella sp.]